MLIYNCEKIYDRARHYYNISSFYAQVLVVDLGNSRFLRQVGLALFPFCVFVMNVEQIISPQHT